VTSECTVGFSNGTVASSCNSRDLTAVPSDSHAVDDPEEPVLADNVHELTQSLSTDSTVVDGVPHKNESSHTSVMISDTQPYIGVMREGYPPVF